MFKFWSKVKRQKIKTAAELPEWFLPEKYKPLVKLDTYGWYSQLYIRQQIFQILEIESFAATKPFRLDELIDQLRENPIFETKPGSYANALLGGKYLAINSDDSHDRAMTLAVSPITASRFYRVDHDMLPDRKKIVTDFYRSTYSDRSTTKYVRLMNRGEWPPFWLHQSILESVPSWQNHSIAFAEIDLSMPIEVIQSHFEVFLRLEKRKYARFIKKQDHRSIGLEKLYRYGIVAYLDLQLWAALNAKSIPLRIMADAIFPSKNEGEEVVRKTVEPLANDILKSQSKTLAFLEAEAIAQRAEKI